MKNKTQIRSKITLLDDIVQGAYFGDVSVFKLLDDYKKLLEYIDLEEDKAYSLASRPDQDWYVGYWKALDHVCQMSVKYETLP